MASKIHQITMNSCSSDKWIKWKQQKREMPKKKKACSLTAYFSIKKISFGTVIIVYMIMKQQSTFGISGSFVQHEEAY